MNRISRWFNIDAVDVQCAIGTYAYLLSENRKLKYVSENLTVGKH